VSRIYTINPNNYLELPYSTIENKIIQRFFICFFTFKK